jgi:hypothetical protein
MADNIMIHPAVKALVAESQALVGAELAFTDMLLKVTVDEGLTILASIFAAITADPPNPDNPDDPQDRWAYFKELVDLALEARAAGDD